MFKQLTRTACLSLPLVGWGATGASETSFNFVNPLEASEDFYLIRSMGIDRFTEEFLMLGATFGDELTAEQREHLLRVASEATGETMRSIVYNAAAGSVVVSAAPTLELVNVIDDGSGTVRFVLSQKPARSTSEQPYALWAGSPSGKPKVYSSAPFRIAEAPMLVFILADMSGSMSGYAGEVKTAVTELLRALPPHTNCELRTFGRAINDLALTNDPKCVPSDFNIANMNPDGGTPLFTALQQAYQTANQPKFGSYQKAVIILTDGAPTDEEEASNALALKGDLYSVFFWLGARSQDAEVTLAPVADAFVIDANQAISHLRQGFAAIADEVESQTVVDIHLDDAAPQSSPGDG